MPNAQLKLQPYTQTRWSCGGCGVFDRGTVQGKIPLVTCPTCGRRSLFMASVNGMTARPLPFVSQPKHPEIENDARHNPRGGVKRNGKSTGRPKKAHISLPVATAPIPLPVNVRLPGDRHAAPKAP